MNDRHQWTDANEGTFVVATDGYLRRANGGVVAELPRMLVREMLRLSAANAEDVARRALGEVG
jgi:hypothetical protein